MRVVFSCPSGIEIVKQKNVTRQNLTLFFIFRHSRALIQNYNKQKHKRHLTQKIHFMIKNLLS